MRAANASSGNHGRAAWSSPAVSRHLEKPCPRCSAEKYARCFKTQSWVPPIDGVGGFYTERRRSPHPERKTPMPAAAVASAKERLRQSVRSAAQRKLPGGERIQVRRWANAIARTEEDLAHKLAELDQMSDLPW